MIFTPDTLHRITDQLATPDCASAHLCRLISQLNTALLGNYDADSQTVFMQCLSLCEERLQALLQEEGWEDSFNGQAGSIRR